MQDWIQIFRVGDYAGKLPVSLADLDDMVRDYSPQRHEAPLVLGHPDTDSPALGWVEKLWRIGDALFAKAVQVAPEFSKSVREGRFKKISMAIYPAFAGTGRPYLRHVGFLGAAAPAVKGMAPILWAEGEYQNLDVVFHKPGSLAVTNAAVGAGSAGAKLDTLVHRHMQEHKVNFSEALIEVQMAHPDLAKEYLEWIRSRR